MYYSKILDYDWAFDHFVTEHVLILVEKHHILPNLSKYLLFLDKYRGDGY